jgi:8-amino-7-oxononanoate synthase
MFEDGLRRIEEAGLARRIRDREGAHGTRAIIDGREYLSYATNDYLGLAGHPALVEAAVAATRAWGAGAGASRLLAGGTAEHAALEEAVRRFKGVPGALLAGSGYLANVGAIPALAEEGDALFCDELNHASLIDGCRLSRASRHVYRHRDPDHLAALLRESRARRKVVVTDTVFSMHGRVAPIREIAEVARAEGAILYMDDAHGTGVLGGGRGALAHFGLAPEPWMVQMGTCSKALGAYGAFLAGAEDVVAWLLNRARPVVFGTALPAGPVAAARAAIGMIESGEAPLARLWENRERMARGLAQLGIDTGGSETPILPIACRDAADAMEVAGRLEREGIYAPAIRPPSVPAPLIRLTVTAAHTEDEIDMTIEALARALELR